MSELIYAALLGNVDRSITKVEIGDGFTLEEWQTDEFVSFYQQMQGSAEIDIWMKLEHAWGYSTGGMYLASTVYVVTKRFQEFPTDDFPLESREEWLKYHRSRERFEVRERAHLEHIIEKLRLCAEGSIKICADFFYNDYNDGPEGSSQEELLHGPNRPYKVRNRDVASILKLLRSPRLSKRHKYLQLALENFNLSYRVAQTELEFLTLMLCLEAIFNDGRQELRNKVSRGCAVLLGTTKSSSRAIFKEVRDLYDKRSVLVHTGDRAKVTDADVLILKDYVRRSLRRALDLDLSKEDLSGKLIEAGFGSARTFARKA